MRLIDADALKEWVEEYHTSNWGIPQDELIYAIGSAPTIDAVPVVRCEDCKHRPTMPEDGEEVFDLEFPDDDCPLQCGDGWYNREPDDDWYCANGKRITDD